jgi:methylamine---glutamate N-methyltransferase subunit C
MTGLHAADFPEAAVRERARTGAAAAFPPVETYGRTLFGAATARPGGDRIDTMRLTPPVFMPHRLERLIELGREPGHADVRLETQIGGFRSALPVYLSAFGSTQVADSHLGEATSRQAARAGLPMVVGENVTAMSGTGRMGTHSGRALLNRIHAYAAEIRDDAGGVVVQQSTEDADAEVWNLTYSDPSVQPLLASGRLAFELKVGQGAKPGLGGMTIVDEKTAARIAGQYAVEQVFADGGRMLRSASPGTFTEEILRQQIHFMRNNFPRARAWVKLHPGRDIRQAALIAWRAGADAVTVDGAEGGTGWAPSCFLDQVGLPLAECLRRIGDQPGCLLASGRMWDGSRAVKCLALGATAVGLGRAALIAADEDEEDGLRRLLECLALELRLLISALGKYSPADLKPEDVWAPGDTDPAAAEAALALLPS